MAIDPSIILGYQPPQLPSPADLEVSELKRVQARQQRDQIIADAQDTRDIQAALQSSVGPDGMPDFAAAIKALGGKNARAQLKLQQFTDEIRSKQYAARKTELDVETKEAEQVAKLAQGLTPENYASVYPSLPPQVQQILGPTFDPRRRDFLVATGTSTKEFNDKETAALDHYLEGDWDKAIAEQLAVFPQAKDHILQNARENWNAPADVISFWQGVPPDQLQQVARDRSLTTQQRETLAGQEAARQQTAENQAATRDLAERREAREAQTQAQQLAISRGNLAVAQGNLKVRQQEAQAGAAGTGGGKLSATAIERLSGVESSLEVASDLERRLRDDRMDRVIGPIQGRVTSAELSLPGVAVDPRVAEFTAQISTLKNSVIKAITGAQMSEAEAKRIMTQVPDITNKPEVFRARLETTRRNLQKIREITIRLSGGTPSNVPTGGATAPADPLGIR